MRGLGILILIVLFFWLIWPAISRWLKRKAMERTEDYIRSSMGMPPRDKKQRRGFRSSQGNEDSFSRQRSEAYKSRSQGPIIPKEYAEDVEFTETIDYSSQEKIKETSNEKGQYHESQISDVEFTEIKKSRSK